MRLGAVERMPGDFRTWTPEHALVLHDLALTGFGFHLPGELLNEVTDTDCAQGRQYIQSEGLDLAQFAVLYGECLFDPDPGVRAAVAAKIDAGSRIAAQLGAQTFLLRPGSRSDAGSWTPHPDNYLLESRDLLIDTLRPLARTAESEGVTLAMETHVVSIMDPPEVCRDIVEAVGSERFRLIMDVVNHFGDIRSVYDSTAFVDRVFDAVGALSPVMHVKDLKVSPGLVVHIDQEVPGEGELDLGRVLERFDALFPDGYGLVEHIPLEQVPLALNNIRRIAGERGVRIY